MLTALVPLLTMLVLTPPGHAIPTEEVTFKRINQLCGDRRANWDWLDNWKHPWVLPGGGLGLKCLHIVVLPPDGRKFLVGSLLLVAPLWRENEHYRVFLASYKIKELPLPSQARVYEVLVPSGVEGGVVKGPWREVQYSLSESEGWLTLKPSEGSKAFVVEAGLPARDEWVRLVLPEGSWLLALGWSKDFNVLTPDGKVIFQGRAPYDEVEYDLGDVHLVLWYAWYLLNLSDKDDDQVRVKIASYDWATKHWDDKALYYFGGFVDFVFDPRSQYEERAFYGPCTLLRLDAKVPVILEFKAPKPEAEAFEYVGEAWDDKRGFYSLEYFNMLHRWVPQAPPFRPIHVGNPLAPGWLLILLLAGRARERFQRARRSTPRSGCPGFRRTSRVGAEGWR